MLKVFLGVVVGTALVAFGATALLNPSITKRFRLDVAVEVDGRVLEGSTVWQMTSTKLFNPLGNSLPIRSDVRGEAIPLRVSENEVLFVLRRGQGGASTRKYGDLLFHGCGIRTFEQLAPFEGTCEVTSAFPDIVSATGDIESTTPPTIGFQETGPVELGRARLVTITVTTTDAPISVGITDDYPWILSMARPDRATDVPGEGVFWMSKLYVQDFTTEAGE